MRRMTSRTDFSFNNQKVGQDSSHDIYAPNGGDGSPFDASNLDEGLYQIIQRQGDQSWEIFFPKDRLIVPIMDQDEGYKHYEVVNNDAINDEYRSYFVVSTIDDVERNFYMIIKGEFVILASEYQVNA